jgi:hypothetical protein
MIAGRAVATFAGETGAREAFSRSCGAFTGMQSLPMTPDRFVRRRKRGLTIPGFIPIIFAKDTAVVMTGK